MKRELMVYIVIAVMAAVIALIFCFPPFGLVFGAICAMVFGVIILLAVFITVYLAIVAVALIMVFWKMRRPKRVCSTTR